MIPPFFRRLWSGAELCAIFIRELALSSWSVAAAAFARDSRLSPAIIAVPLQLRTDMGIMTLANLVSLTPGTTSLHVSQDRSLLYVHCLDAGATDDVIAGIRETFEDTIKEMEQ
ncbi:MAG: Na+/H+ antiporter subunit E [Pigmentiphaga sp.]|nr:Na+/H+ antiporter subunit E [Pigmentiphaga sp.]